MDQAQQLRNVIKKQNQKVVNPTARVITVTSGKGGVGKTTLAANIGVALAQMEKKVLLIDLDIGLRNLDLVLGIQNIIVYDLIDVYEEKIDFVAMRVLKKYRVAFEELAK